jgi:alkylation response protein AidB-like acyl-CoA dehydrogenase
VAGRSHPWHTVPLGLGEDAEEYRARVCAWLCEAMAGAPADARDRTGFRESFERALLREAGARGHLDPEAPPARAAVFAYEAAYHDAPLIDTGVVLASAPLRLFGTEEQRADLLPGMVEGTETWCIAYTEPDAGNDLFTGMSTTAVPDGDGWRLDGVKSLVTGAAKADRCVTVARTGTDPRGRPELTMFTLPMSTDGVRVRRRPTIAGYTLDEIHFDGVRVGPAAVLGEVGKGRRQLAAAVRAEHGAVFHAGWADRMLHELATWCRECGADPVTRDVLAALWAKGAAARELAFSPVRDPSDPVAPSAAKVFLTEFLQEIARAATEIPAPAGGALGSIAGPAPAGAPWGGRFAFEYLFRVDGPISVGANELHRDTIARHVVADPARTAPDPARTRGPAGRTDEVVGAFGPGRATGADLAGLLAVVEDRAAAGRPSLAPLVLARGLLEPGDGRVYLACDAGAEGTTPRPTLREGRLRGAVPGFPDPALYGNPRAVRLLVVAEGPTGARLVVVDATADGVRHERVPSISPWPSGDLILDTPADGGAPVDEHTLVRARDVAALVVAAESVGAAARALRVGSDDVRAREAYGGVLADLQAVRQRVADMYIDVCSARAVVIAAALNPALVPVPAAKAYVDEAACRATASAHRLCGGRGYLEDFGLGGAYRGAKAGALTLGSTRRQRARIAAEVLGG